jgi:coiled-coil domain-containing protein 55
MWSHVKKLSERKRGTTLFLIIREPATDPVAPPLGVLPLWARNRYLAMSGFSLGDTSVTTTLKYGLNAAAGGKKGKEVKPRQVARPIAAFADADDDAAVDLTNAAEMHRRGNDEVSRQQQAALTDTRAIALRQQALAEDASVFEYDSHHDTNQSLKKQKMETKDEERTLRKSRYVETLMAKRDEREKEEEILKERRLLKERQKEDHLYGDKEKFVTAAYKEKLAKDAVWQKIEAKKDAAETEEAVVGSKNIASFYAHLMNGNTAATDAVATPELVTDTTGGDASAETRRASARRNDKADLDGKKTEYDELDRRKTEHANETGWQTRETKTNATGDAEAKEREKEAAEKTATLEKRVEKIRDARERFLERKRKRV